MVQILATPTVMLLLSLTLLGCRPSCGVEVRYTDSPHTVELSWTESGWSGALVYGYAQDLSRTAEVLSSGDVHTAVLTGLPALETIYYQLTIGGQECADVFTTNNLDPSLPGLTVALYDPAEAGSWQQLAGVAMGESPALFVIDRFGNWLWEYPHDPDLISSAVALDGREVLYNTFSQDRTNDVGEVHRLTLEGEVLDDVRTEGAHHVFAMLPDGAIAYPSIDVREWINPKTGEKESVVGDRLMEISTDGVVREVFNIWDHEEPVEHDAWDSGFYPQGADWTHANAVNYDATRDSYLFSLAHMNVIYEIDRTTGEPMHRFSQDWVVSGSRVFEFQHDPNWTEDGTLLMVSYTDTESVAVEYAVDESADTLTEVWSYARDKDGTPLLGQARRLEGGNTFINYGGHGAMREVTPAGSLVWLLESDLGSWFGNAVLLDGLF